MKCPVCGKEGTVRIHYSAKCGVCVHEKCWQTHLAQAHKD